MLKLFKDAAVKLKLILFGKDKPGLPDFTMLCVGLVNPITGGIVAYVKADGTLVDVDGADLFLKLSGNQTVAGNKTFSGNVSFSTEAGVLTVNNETVIMDQLPTNDPSEPGQLWNDGGVLTISAG
jgi:hypothetical protein